MDNWIDHTARARSWFEILRDRICAEFEAIEREAGSDASFTFTPWNREVEGEAVPHGGGGVQANVNRWYGQFQEPREKIGAKSEETKIGKHKVVMHYKRAWETGVAPAKELEFTIDIKKP